MAGGIRVIKVQRWEDYLRSEELQRATCGPFERAVVPADLMKSMNEQGGLLLMALLGDEPVGFAFGYPSLQGRVVHHHSDSIGVLGKYRHRGVGFQLRSKQREEVLAQGLDRITWRLDPLQADHSNLTFRKLGASGNVYLRDDRGRRGTNPDGAPPGDRLWAEWRLEDPGVLARLRGGNLAVWDPHGDDTINATVTLAGGSREPTGVNLRLHASPLFLEIPWDLQAVNREYPDAAMAWRREVGQALEHYFARRYRITDFALDRKYRRAFHVLTCVA